VADRVIRLLFTLPGDPGVETKPSIIAKFRTILVTLTYVKPGQDCLRTGREGKIKSLQNVRSLSRDRRYNRTGPPRAAAPAAVKQVSESPTAQVPVSPTAKMKF